MDNDEHEQADLAGYHGDARRVQDERAAARSRAKAHMFARNFLKGVHWCRVLSSVCCVVGSALGSAEISCRRGRGSQR